MDANGTKKRSNVDDHQVFKLCSSILIPVMIGLLTVTVSIVQLYIANQERQQDFAISEANRDKDRFIAARTREQDLLIANKLRWDTILATYIKEMSGIFTKLNFSSTRPDPILMAVVRAKTLIACRQLDVVRKAWMIQFLYESGAILVGHNPIDMTSAYLDGIDLSASASNSIQQASLNGISLSGALLNNASFDQRYLTGANFSGCAMLRASFKDARLDGASFQKSCLRDADFNRSSTKRVNFVWSDLRRSNLNDYQLQRASSFYLAVLPNGTFGRHPNLLTNGNAEQIRSCSPTRLTPITHGQWIVAPSQQSPNVGFMTVNASLVEPQTDYSWTEALAYFWISEDMNTSADISGNIGRCSFVTTIAPVSLIQHFNIPKYYQHVKHLSFSWHLAIFCGKLADVDIKISLVLEERNDHGETLEAYQMGELD